MARTDWQGAGYGALEGGLGGATSGAALGFTFGGPPGALVGGAIGAGVGILGGAITGMLDADDQRELERAMNEQQDALDKAQNRFQANVSMAGDAASELVGQTMTAKNAQDVAKADSVMEEASRVADASGLIGAEKADYLLKARESANKQSAASTPAVYQQVQQGAMAARGQEVQKAAYTLQSEQTEIGQELQRLGATELPDNTAAFGQVMGTAAQLGMMAKSVDTQSKLADAYAAKGALGGTPSTAKGALGGIDPESYGAIADVLTAPWAQTAPGGTMTQPGMQVDTLPADFMGSNIQGTAAPTQAAPTQAAPTQAAALGGVTAPTSGESFAPGATQAQMDQLRNYQPPETASIPGYGSLEDPYIMSGTDPGMMTPDQLMSSTPEPQQYGVIPQPLGPQPDAVLFPTLDPGQQTQSTTYPSMQQVIQSAIDSDAAAAATPIPYDVAFPSFAATPTPTPAATPTPTPAATPERTLSADFGTPEMRDPFSGDLSSAPAVTPAPAAQGKGLSEAEIRQRDYGKELLPGHQWVWDDTVIGYVQKPFGVDLAGFASGGMAGTTGPEVAVLGEEGPELVLNAKQTRELATALGGATAYAMGGVAGAKKKLPGYAGGGVAGAGRSQFEMDPEELLEYLRAFKDMQGAL